MGEAELVLLHGTLDACIHSASDLPNMDRFSETLRRCLTMFAPCKTGVGGPNCIHREITSDPYVCIVLGGVTVARTHVIPNETNPVWDQHFVIPVAHSVREVEFQVKDNDVVGTDFIASMTILASSLFDSEIEKKSYVLLAGKDRKFGGRNAMLTVSLKYCPVGTDPHYQSCVNENPQYAGIPNTYFPLQKSGCLTLYQDADVPDGCLPEILLDEGMKFEHSKCWEDIFDAIQNAKHLVYIAGWSIYTPVALVRNGRRTPSETLGDLLKKKAEEDGMQVLLFVWDDNTSRPILQNDGVMNTHDEKTRRFFKKSKVECILAPRCAHRKLSWFKKKFVEAFYSHHQKLVVVDVEGKGDRRHIVAFLGGLDLAKGRYDTPQHSLFTNLNTTFSGDFHNPSFPRAGSGGPRQPWHDLHCKIEGLAAYDVLKSFGQCWQNAWKRKRILSKLKRSIRGFRKPHFNVENMDWHSAYHLDENSPENWHIQVLRSIDSGSVEGFPKFTKSEHGKVLKYIFSSSGRSRKGSDGTDHRNLIASKNIAIDMSIQKAYIKAIRSAQHFIYIENQYFIGSSFGWPTYKVAGSNHLVPIEIALKIANKIKLQQPFVVYIVIPMWPEGVPDSTPAQKMLFFQSQTMKMMYTIIFNTLKELDLHLQYKPTDFLKFFCLGNREQQRETEALMQSQTSESSQLCAQNARRFMVYVHSKGMIVDDEYLIMGSANINQRSMDGCRDTEIAIGAYQPHYSWEKRKGLPKGQIHGYRRSLWVEHLGVDDDCFQQPWTLECRNKVQKLANENWEKYIAEEASDMKGHLMPYPIQVQVDSDGNLQLVPEPKSFPDIGGQILGRNTTIVPDLLIA